MREFSLGREGWCTQLWESSQGGGKALENDDVDVLWENNVNQYEDYCNIGQRVELIINVCRI